MEGSAMLIVFCNMDAVVFGRITADALIEETERQPVSTRVSYQLGYAAG
jgi:hypothetical protein